ncbi:Serine/threonine-protein kinase StkP [Planctomycetes bacterium Poly30]|uniref:Serine/threonine-protein kinase StkP n=1 Tax=Saltatorellus ferox TaxID=2528018 RepID=A0A518ETR1_9BACT|nr:Serine/threonine-protein kinase StkP [Planctomycetes bacterium Poly30]
MKEERESKITELIARCLEAASEGEGDAAIDSVRAEHPELVEEVLAGLRVAGRMPGFAGQQPDDVSAVGRLLSDRYRVTRRIGAGAMGIVYEADDLELGRKVAIKVLRTGLFERGEALQRFEREATALASIDHDAVVRIYDRGVTEEGSPILVMEYIDGASCADVLERAALLGEESHGTAWLTEHFGLRDIREEDFLRLCVRWAASLAGGLGAAHAAGVFHRDVKPSNVMIRRDGRAVLLDFGISVRADHATLTLGGSTVGTPAYMAPEAAFGKVKAQSSVDVYGLSATLYHMLTSSPPYVGNATEVMAAVATREPVPARRLRPGLPRDTAAILEHGLERQPSARYQTAHELEDDLRAFLAYRTVSVRPTSAFTRLARQARRSRLVQGATLAALLFGLIWGGILWQRHAASARAERFAAADAYPAVPPNLGVVSKVNRRVRDPELQAEIERTLDRVVVTRHRPVTAYLLRGAFRWDHGDRDGAARDFASLADAAGTEYSKSLAQLYADATRLPAGEDMELELTSLPDPDSDEDRYVAAYHLMRAGQSEGAEALLAAANLEGNRHAQEFQALFGFSEINALLRQEPVDEDALYAVSEALALRIIRMEEADGYRTATSYSLLGTHRLRQNRYPDALELCEKGLELCPSAWVLRINAASAASELGRHELAAHHAREGLRFRPGFHKFSISLYEAEARAGNFDAARLAIEEGTWTDTGATPLDAIQALGWVQLEEAIQFIQKDPERARASATAAMATVAELPGERPGRQRIESRAQAILDGDVEQLRKVLLGELLESPTSLSRLDVLRETWPDCMEEGELKLLGAWFEQLYLELSRPTRASAAVK